METKKCPKYKFHDFAQRQGWLLLYDTIKEDGSSVSYLLQDGNSLIADFDNIGEFKALTDITNARTAVELDSENSKLTQEGEDE